MNKIIEIAKDYPKFWYKDNFDKDRNRICKYPFIQWMITAHIAAGCVIMITSYL